MHILHSGFLHGKTLCGQDNGKGIFAYTAPLETIEDEEYCRQCRKVFSVQIDEEDT